jgi:hypothetical protein
MFQIVVVIIPYSEFSLQVPYVSEFMPIVEFFLVFPMATFYRTILGRFSGINQVMNDIVFSAENVQSVNCFHH